MKRVIYSIEKFQSIDDVKFLPEDYSLLKFGSVEVAQKFGYRLAEQFFLAYADKLIANKCLIIPSPYNFVKNAATLMTLHFVDRINELLIEVRGEHVEFMTIQRKVSYVNDYGFLSKEKRQALIGNDRFFFNREFVKGKLLIFIDDCRITGTHQDKIEEILDEREIKNEAMFLYFAEYLGDEPDIEAKLNFAGIKSIQDYVKLLKSRDMEMIVRPIKFMLGQDGENFDFILRELDDVNKKKLYNLALNEGYYKIPRFQANLKRLKEECKKNNVVCI